MATASGKTFVHDAVLDARFRAAQRALARRRQILPLVTIAALLGLWEASVAVFDIKSYIAPAPSAVAKVFVVHFDMLLLNLWPTAVEAILGFLLGNAAAVLVATAFVYRRTVEEAFFPVVVIINSIPVVAKAPILVLLLGNGLEPKVAIAALICFFPTLVNMTRGLSAVSPQQMELMRILSASPREIFVKLRLHTALPYLFSALKISASTAVIGALVAEWIGSTSGLGALILQTTLNFDSPLLYATIVVSSAFSAALFGAISWAERRLLKWHAVQPG